MSKYSLLFEADEYKVIGPLRFPIYDNFSPGETRAYNKLNKEFAGSSYASMTLASKISRDNQIKPAQAMAIISSISDPANQDYLFRYADDIRNLSDSVVGEDEQKAAFVTLFIQLRGQVKVDGTYESASDWETEDTDRVPGNLINDIYDFMVKEKNGGQVPLEVTPEPPAAPEEPSPNKRRLTSSSAT